MVRSKINHNNTGYWFIAPFVIGFLVFGLYPVYNTIALSFTDTTLMKADSNFIAFKNFERLFADKTFLTAIKNTWTLWIMNFIPQIGIALLLSVWFTSNRLKIKGGGIWRMLFYLPNLLMPAAIAALFFSLFSFYGPVNQFLVRGGYIPEAVDFIRSPSVMRGLVVFIQWWMWFGQTTILIMAGMTSISLSLYEAAVMDGANTWKMFRYITAPLIKPVLVYVLVTSLVGGMQMFDIPMLLTDGRGSPANSILTNNILMYMKFRSSQGHIGAASSVGVVVFIMTSFVSLLIFYLLREKSDEKMAKGN
ncbi:MAG: carbohydrate ABC transporter permease [Anaerolineaceae bacterium]|jgi:multiple sugar transport system permease protein|nr:MAG: sugar ABC transporter permease [Chloroflexi bacterium HGW-Chloroflexi-8]